MIIQIIIKCELLSSWLHAHQHLYPGMTKIQGKKIKKMKLVGIKKFKKKEEEKKTISDKTRC